MKYRLLAGLALLLAVTGPGWGEELQAVPHPEELGFAPGRLERITRTFQGFVDHGQLPGAVVLIARNDQIVYVQAFGFRDKERNLPMTTDAIFRIASMTKPIVSVAAMTLVEEGKLDLAAPVADYLPEFKELRVAVEHKDPATGKTVLSTEPVVHAMTVQDLMRHTSGLTYGPPTGEGPVSLLYREHNVANRDETLAQLVTKLAALPLAHQPRMVWDYSMATDVLGRVIEVVSGMDLDRFIAERVTKPLGMASTGFSIPETDKDRVAQPLADPAATALFDPTVKPKLLSGQGGAVSTVGDYLRFCEMLMDGGKFGEVRVLAPSTIALMTSNALPPDILYGPTGQKFGDIAPSPAEGQGFGLGFAVRTAPGVNPLPGSVGSFYWSGAYGTSFYIDPDEKLILIMMAQVPANPAPYRHAFRYLAYQALVTPE